MLISRISLRISNGTVGLPPRAFDFHRQYKRNPARCHLITVSGLTIASASRTPGEKPIKANKNQAVDGAEGLFLRIGSPQNVYLLPQHPKFHLKRRPRPKQIGDHPNNEPDNISHPARASPDSRSTASQIEFAIGTAVDFGGYASRRVSCSGQTRNVNSRNGKIGLFHAAPGRVPGREPLW
jgi:hypothetical protein